MNTRICILNTGKLKTQYLANFILKIIKKHILKINSKILKKKLPRAAIRMREKWLINDKTLLNVCAVAHLAVVGSTADRPCQFASVSFGNCRAEAESKPTSDCVREVYLLMPTQYTLVQT